MTPRQWLRIDVLRKRYDAGASPLREALNRLSAEGFVVQKDQRGFVVADINESDLDEFIFTRCSLNEIMLPTALERGDTGLGRARCSGALSSVEDAAVHLGRPRER